MHPPIRLDPQEQWDSRVHQVVEEVHSTLHLEPWPMTGLVSRCL